METIEEGLSSIDSELVKDRRNIQDTAEADEVADVQNYADATNAIEHHGAMDLSSDTDADSLAYTASVFTIQVVLSLFRHCPWFHLTQWQNKSRTRCAICLRVRDSLCVV